MLAGSGGLNPPPQNLIDFINEGSVFLVAGHREPDGDCIGSQLALASFLKRMGKEAILCSAGPFKRSEVKQYEELFCSAPNIEGKVIVVDCSLIDRTGELEPFLDGLPIAIIDHHRSNNNTGGFVNSAYIEPAAPSTTVLIMKLIKAMGLEPSREEAEYMFLGLCTDTGFFRHVDSDGADTFEYAAAMIHSGANPKVTYQAIYGGKSLSSRKLLGRVLSRIESFYGGKLVISTEEFEETCIFGQEGRDSDSYYQLLQTVSDVEAIVIIRQETLEKCTIGFRSRSWVDVRTIAEALGGGGHKHAAGCSISGTIPEIKTRIIKAFESVF